MGLFDRKPIAAADDGGQGMQRTLGAGDLIYTGTPAGVGAVVAGDRLSARIDGLAPLDITIGPPSA